ncbi:Hypothetical predicted protein [Pelobates cultripes]|uniref:Centromere protein J n=1 Tax=Pelobates cultripes TaxID=61616 RepID=A0AAD1RFC7_PELCU|nr:Hypothetical predicted protein [Pelobates cultripes]
MPAAMPALLPTQETSENMSPWLPKEGIAQPVSIAAQLPEVNTSTIFATQCSRVPSSPKETVTSASNTQVDEGHKPLSPVREEKDENANNTPITPFGIRTRTKNREDRPIRPGIGERQKTFEDFVEEQLKVDSEILEKEIPSKQNTDENKTASRKSFLKRGEGITRFEKKYDNTIKEQRRHSVTTLSRRVSFDGPHRNSLPIISNIAKMQVKNNLISNKISSHSDLISTGNSTNNGASDKAGNHSSNRCQQMHEMHEKAKSLVVDNQPEQFVKDSSDLTPRDMLDISTTDQKTTTHKDLITTDVSQKAAATSSSKIQVSELTDLEGNLLKNSLKNVSELKTQTVDSSIHDLIGPSIDKTDPSAKTGFKKVNDRIIKVNEQKKYQKSINDHQTHVETCRENIVQKEHVESPSEKDSTSSFSDNDPKSHFYKLPTHDTPKSLNQVDRHLDLSDPDYASDEPSGEEEIKISKSSAKIFSNQDSSSTSDSEHSTEDFRRRGSKAFSSFRSTSSRLTRNTRKESEPDKKTECKDDTEKVELKNPPFTCDLVTSLFPTLKLRTDNTEQSNKLSEVLIDESYKPTLGKVEDIKEGIYDYSLISKMKEEQTKAMMFLREQIDHLERLKTDELNRLEEFKKEEMRKIQKEKEELDKQAAAIKAIHESEKNEQLQMLKEQISELQVKFRRNEFHWLSTNEQLRNQIDALAKENQELRMNIAVSTKAFTQRYCGTGGEAHWRKDLIPVSQAIMRGTFNTKSDLRVEQNVHQNRGKTPIGRKTPVMMENSTKVTNIIERAEFGKPPLRNGDRAPSGSISRSTTPTGRKTPLQGRLTPFEPEKVVPLSVSKHRKSPLTVSNFTVFKDSSISSTSKGRPSSYSGSSDDMPAAASVKNEDCISLSQDSKIANQDVDTLSVRKFEDQPYPWEQVRPSTNLRTHSVTSSGRKTPVEYTHTSETKSSHPKSILSRKSSTRGEKKSSEDDTIQEETQYPDGKVEQLLSDGRRVIGFNNGTKKEISADGSTTTVSFFNGDVKKIMPDQSIVYYYADAQTTHTTYPNGLEVLQFPNKQMEKHHPDGTKEIVFPDRTIKLLFRDGREETTFPDGTIVKLEKNGQKTVTFHNGQKEIHTAQFKRREYPDGTIKTVYSNGRQETKYSSGRVRIKDQQGNIILDKK